MLPHVLRDLWEYLKETKKTIVLYGMGNGADKILSVLAERGICVGGIFASDEYVRGQEACGFKVTTYKEAKEKYRPASQMFRYRLQKPPLHHRL